MDENSCEDETSKNVENAADGQKEKNTANSPELKSVRIRITVERKASQNDIPNRCVSSFDASGPSADFCASSILKSENIGRTDLVAIGKPAEYAKPSAPIEENESIDAVFATSVEEREPAPEPSAPVQENCLLPDYGNDQDIHPHVRMVSDLNKQLMTRKTSIGPPPSYSFVMKQKKKLKSVPSPDPLVINRPPPPTYAGTRGLFLTPEESRLERICNLPSFVEPVWRAHSQPALCPRCGVIVLTTTHSHDSVATHVAALALCLFGCWPCCLLPYCMNVCKNTYHHCPICQAYLGLYTPW